MVDNEIRNDIIAQTAKLRFSVRAQGLRDLLRQRGLDPNRCFQVSCDQGDDVCICLVLPDGTIVDAEYREHYQTRQAIRFVDWAPQTYSEPEFQLCREVLANPQEESRFDDETRRYFEDHIAEADAPLPALKWGARIWHLLEGGPTEPTDHGSDSSGPDENTSSADRKHW